MSNFNQITRRAALLSATLLVPALAAAADPNAFDLVQPGTISIGTMADSKPNTFVQVDGTFTGFDIDLFMELAARMGFPKDKVTITAQDFSALMPSVANRRFDIAIAAIGTTAERKKNVDFSDGYLLFYLSALSADTSIKDASDLTGKRVGAVQGTLADIHATKHFAGADIVRFPDVNTSIAALNSGTIDVQFMDHAPALNYSKRYPKLQVRFDVPQPDTPAGYVVRKGNDNLREGVNKALRAAIDDGTYKKLFEKWFPGDPMPEMFARK